MEERLETAIFAIKNGTPIEEASHNIGRKDFEGLVAEILETIVYKQIERVKHYIANTKVTIAAPVIVTLYQEETSFVDRVPIVPILQFSSFIDDFYGNLEYIRTIEK